MSKTKTLTLVVACATGIKIQESFWDRVDDDLDSWKANIENFDLDTPISAWIEQTDRSLNLWGEEIFGGDWTWVDTLGDPDE